MSRITLGEEEYHPGLEPPSMVCLLRAGAPLNYLDAEQLFVRLLNTQDLDQQLQCVRVCRCCACTTTIVAVSGSVALKWPAMCCAPVQKLTSRHLSLGIVTDLRCLSPLFHE